MQELFTLFIFRAQYIAVRSIFLTLLCVCCMFVRELQAQLVCLPKIHGMYGQWGYNRDRYSRSDIRFIKGGAYDFTIQGARAHDKPDFTGFWETPLDITIPQNSFRIGFYLDAARTRAIELNFDHAKYVMEKGQRAHLTGTISGEPVDADTVIDPWFVSFEHTNGANFYAFDYVSQHPLWQGRKRTIATAVWKAGGGFAMPKSDITLMGIQLDNRYHIAGYLLAAEVGARFYFSRRLFAEATLKGGWANFADVLTVEGGRASHRFWFGEVLGLVGYDLPFRRKGFGRVGE